jgi:steroid delta-isomerase-like uncharacterized protein
MVALLDGGVERVEVGMEDGGFQGERMFASELGQYKPRSLSPARGSRAGRVVGSRTSKGAALRHLAIAHRYFDGWNAHDADAIAATFAPGGTYTDPTVSDLDGPATGAYALSLVAAFPDLRFDLVSTAETEDGGVAAQWVMRGTNTASFMGLPPTGRAFALPGADFITFAGDGIATVTGYFDGGKLARDLGLDVIVQPSVIGPWRLGISSRLVARDDVEPGAFGLTVLEARSDDEVAETRLRSREIADRLVDLPGFLSFMGVTVGRRMFTISAWETPEAIQQVRALPEHREAVGRLFGPHLAANAMTSIWAPWRTNGTLVRCEACDKMMRVAAETCTCGAPLPQGTAW